jgi:ribA/ribD-fused uncharacterized protein
MTRREDFINEQGIVDTIESSTHIYGLFGKYRPLSNFHMENLVVDEITFRCSEAAYMSKKTRNYDHKKYLASLNASEAKHFGQQVDLRPDWEAVKDLAMYEVLYCKFAQSPSLARLLVSTGTKIIEETNWCKNMYWGVHEGKGLNKLGLTLMQIRESVRE